MLMREMYVWPLHEDIAELQLRWWQCSGSNLAVAGESGSTSEAEAAATEVIVFVAEENVIVENSGKAAEEGDSQRAPPQCAATARNGRESLLFRSNSSLLVAINVDVTKAVRLPHSK